MKLKKLAMGFILGLGIATTSVLGYATITYIMNKTVNESIIVGDTAVYSDGLIVELAIYDNHTLTFYELDETETMKHSITYVYNYEILVSGMNIEVSSLSNNITVTELTYTDTTISITFSLNQAMEFESGSILAVQFYFEAVDYSVINMNDTSIPGLMSIGFTEMEATSIIAYTGIYTNLADVYINNDVSDAITRFEHLVNDGTIIFN